MTTTHTESGPGFRRRFRITPTRSRVCAELEDDYHCMRVALEHDGVTATSVQAELERAPWSTCPGAVDVCRQTFSGQSLDEFPRLGGKNSNCTHLYDLALLAAAHALDEDSLLYDVFVSDPVDDVRRVELLRNGELVLAWSDRKFEILEPAELAGMNFNTMRPWIDSLDAAGQEAARVLRWGSVIAHGRSIPLAQQSDARRMPPNCYTFQPERAVAAARIGAIRDFSKGRIQPLERLAEAQS